MIHGFPTPYPDELFYSVLARREKQMGYPSYKGILREVFGCTGTVVTFEFPSHLGHLITGLPASHPFANLVQLEQLTLLPWYKPFLPPERCDQIRAAMLESGGRDCWNRAGITASRVKPPEFLRYCPDCLREDMAGGMTPYWRRLHQMAGIDICPKHRAILENSDIHRLKRRYRYLLPSESLLETPSRRIRASDEHILGLARLGEELLSREWPVLGLPKIRENYLKQLGRVGYINGRGEVKMGALLQDLQSFYSREFLERLGCRGQHWVLRMLRASVSIQQPIRHLLLLNFIGVGLEDLFYPKPLLQPTNSPPVIHANLACVNHLCPDHGIAVCGFVAEERSSMLGGMIETYRCETCGQVQARCRVGHERIWVRDYGHLWRARLTELWADPALGLRAISGTLRVSCDTARKHALKLGLPLTRSGRRPLSVRSYPHLLVPKAEKRMRKVENLRKRWLAVKERFPDVSARGLREKLPAVYATLFRYDRKWLKAHQPPRKPRERSVDWDERDEIVCRNLELAAGRLPSATPRQLACAAGIGGWISDRLSKLPRARDFWLRLTTSHSSRDSQSGELSVGQSDAGF
jgi:hypothetical protein